MAEDRTFLPSVIACPSCPKCGTRMMLILILPERRGYDLHTYECPRCEHEITETIEIRKVS
jgi:DNA-directed RNA polymerase subunit M/transcription elongation factor TFIIS